MNVPVPDIVLSVRQPWALALVLGHKPVENRRWSTTWLETARPRWVFIHASAQLARLTPHTRSALLSLWPGLPEDEHLTKGAVLGACEFTGCLDPNSRHLPASARDWATGPKCWMVSRSVSFVEPVPAKGRLGLWKPPEDVADALADEWPRAIPHAAGRPA